MPEDMSNSGLLGLDDAELMRRSRNGETACFEALVLRYEGRLLRFLQQRCGNRHDAEDLAQKSFVCAFRALGRFDCGRPFGPWLFTIARRQAVSHGRVRRFEPLPPEEQWPEKESRPGGNERGIDLWKLARERLPEKLFSVLWMKYAEDMPVADVARVMGVTGIHARVLLHRARRTLADEVRRIES